MPTPHLTTNKHLRVLIVDHNPLLAGTLQSLLKAQGFTVNGIEHTAAGALRHLANRPCDAVCVDAELPDSSDLELLAAIRQAHPQIHVVLLGHDSRRETITRALQAGAVGYIGKPVTAGRVQDILRPIAEMYAPEALPAGNGPTVLVVDQNPQMHALLSHMLRGLGYRVLGEAESGMDGLILLEKHRPAAVCMAIDTPDVGGLDALTAIKACHPEIAVVFVTAHAERETVQQAISRGANGYILKPFTTDNVGIGMRNALEAAAPAAAGSPATP